MREGEDRERDSERGLMGEKTPIGSTYMVHVGELCIVKYMIKVQKSLRVNRIIEGGERGMTLVSMLMHSKRYK